jgi:hypothetical protein
MLKTKKKQGFLAILCLRKKFFQIVQKERRLCGDPDGCCRRKFSEILIAPISLE